ncbi:MAG: glycosyltransferase [Gammaproteobacteria bacterium]|nr:glycosyltransferase [Gammaproteobacteria bacterium]
MIAKKKLCVLVPAHWAALMGGSEYQVSCLVEHLVRQEHYDIYYLARRVSPDYVPQGYKIIQVADAKGIRRFGEFLDAPRLLTLLARIRPDIIYQRVGCGYTGIAAYHAARNPCQVIWHVAHEMEVQPFNRVMSKNMLFRYLDKKTLEYGIRNVGKIIVQTSQQQALLARHYNRVPVARIDNWHPIPQEKIEKPEGIEVVWVANLKAWKQPDLFLRLARDLAHLRDVRFTMIGDRAWPEERQDKFLQDVKRLENLSYLGGCTQDEVNSVLARANIFVNTSVQEGFPNTFIQAWMRQVPVVSLNVNPDNVLDERHIGYCSGTYDQLKHNVLDLIDQPGMRQRMGLEAQDYAFSTYSIKNFEKIAELLEV